MTLEEEAKAINEMSETIVDAIFGKDFGSKAKERLRKRYMDNVPLFIVTGTTNFIN